MYRTRRKSGFTLVEILIVVIILGILAAIVIPQFTNASQDARKSNLASQCQTLKSQIELYKLQHHDKAPDLVTNWDPFIFCSDDTGLKSTDTNQAQSSTTFPYGPYMQAQASNPLVAGANGSKVGAPGTVDGSVGWTYNTTTGVIHGIAPESVTATNFHETDDGVNDINGTPIP